MKGLTPRQAQVLWFIRQYVAANDGASPTYEQIADHMGFASKSGAWVVVNDLVGRGHIRRVGRSQSGLEIVESRSGEVQAMNDDDLTALLAAVVGELADRATRAAA